MGELDPRPFAVFDDMLPENDGGKKRKENDGGKGCSHTKDYCEITESVQLCSFWESNLRDQTWHPFETIEVHGNKE
ncbi:hypothetical protein MKW94_012193, partial [Papaver nudicaule]|nr:hypothetical protein [Papaver nudicaule]